MRINLHQHTLQIKDKDPITRDLDIKNPEQVRRFFDNLQEHNVKILAITNHNWFDIEQFNFLEKICKEKEPKILLLPGIEIDILDSNNDRHNLNVIVDSNKKIEWNQLITDLIQDKNTAGKYAIKITDLVNYLSGFEKIFLVPNEQKANKSAKKTKLKGNLPEEDLEIIKKASNGFWFLETTQKKSSFILSFKGIPTLYGSDELDIFNHNYHDLPNIRVNIDSFENLLKFLNRDTLFLNELMESKKIHDLKLKHNDWEEDEKPINVPIFQDINIIIGPRGTGKSQILETIKLEIEKEKGIEELKFHKQEGDGYEKILEQSKLKFKNPINLDNATLKLNEILKDTKTKYNFSEIFKNFNNLIKYYKNTKRSEKFQCWVEFILSESSTRETSDNEIVNSLYLEFKTNIFYLKETLKIIEKNKNKNAFFNNNYLIVKKYIKQIIDDEFNLFKQKYNKNKSSNTIEKIVIGVQTLINGLRQQKSLPIKLGLYQNFVLRYKLEDIIKMVLGWEERITKRFELGAVSNEKTLFIKRKYLRAKNKKGLLKNEENLPFKYYENIANSLHNIENNIWNSNLQKQIINFKKAVNKIEINSIKIETLKPNYFIWYLDVIEDKNGNPHNPSPGEKQILNLTNYLTYDQEYYFLDEPEKSLDNDFINNTIVEIIKKKALEGKTIIIVTHNANIGVRSLPYLTIYRKPSISDSSKYETYFGSPFSNKMNGTTQESLLWSETCSQILEGGKDAFIDRHKYYGKPS